MYRYVRRPPSPEHRPCYIVGVVLALLALLATIILSTLAFTDVGHDIGLFTSSIDETSDSRTTPLDASEWAFYIWFFIFVFQLVFIIYSHTLICRRSPSGKGYLYYDPPFLSPTVYGLYVFGLALSIVWLFANDQDYLAAAFVSLVGSAFCLDAVVTIVARDLFRYINRISNNEVWFNVLVIHNGLALFSTWLEVASLFSLATVLKYLAKLNDTATGVIPLVILAIIIIGWFILDIFVFTIRARYIFTPYVVWIVALSAIIDRNWDPDDGIQIFVAALLSIALLELIVKIFVTLYRASRKPLGFEL